MAADFSRYRGDIIRDLVAGFGKTIEVSVIQEVAKNFNYDVRKSVATLQQLSGMSQTGNNGRFFVDETNYKSTREINEAIKEIRAGFKILLLLRGLPGSGKSHLAKRILELSVENAIPEEHIFSADNFFVVSGVYTYDPRKISDAHRWTSRKVFDKMLVGFSPLIIDNTNTQAWEMKEYVHVGLQCGYKVIVLEVSTVWSFNINELTHRNVHNVPKAKIKVMLDRYERGITALSLIKSCGLHHDFQTKPQLRKYPRLSDDMRAAALDHLEAVDAVPPPQDVHTEDWRVIKPPKKPDISSWGVDESTLRNWKCVTNLEHSPGPSSISPVNIWTFPHGVEPRTVDASTTTENHAAEEISTGKTLTTRNRDINPPTKLPPVHKTGMHDKSCWTEGEIHDLEENLTNLCLMFPNIPTEAVTNILDYCSGDYEMAVEFLLTEHDSCNGFSKEPTIEDIPVVEAACAAPPSPEEEINIKAEESPSSESESELDPGNVSNSEDESSGDLDKIVELNLNEQLPEQLLKMFGESASPRGLQPVIQVPQIFAKQLYSFYVESMIKQMATQREILARLEKEDEAFAKRLQGEENGETEESKEEGLGEIMNEQAALRLQQQEASKWKETVPNDLAAKMTRDKLTSIFPTVDKEQLVEILHANEGNYEQTFHDLMASVDSNEMRMAQDMMEPPISQAVLNDMEKSGAQTKPSTSTNDDDEDRTHESFREEANNCLAKRAELLRKAQLYHSMSMGEVAQYYSALAEKQSKLYDLANHKAATVLLEEHSKRLHSFDTLDLHYLFVKEAIPALDVFIDRNINLLQGSPKSSQKLLIITGRGIHSKNGQSKLKPAVIRRLSDRNIHYVEINPGLLKIKIHRNSITTNDL